MDSLICTQCNMTFRSLHFLLKHKEKFCIGAISQSNVSQSQKIREKIKRHKQTRTFPKTQSIPSVQTSQHEPEPNTPGVFEQTDDAVRSEHRHTKHLAEVHGATVSDGHERVDVQGQAPTLIAQIDYELQELAAQDGKMEQLWRMLSELNEHEQRNTALLQTIKEHLHQNGQDPVPPSTAFAIPQERVIEKYVPVYGCGVLSTEISTLHLSYLQSGGQDPHILAHMQKVLDAAIKFETGKRPKRPRRDLSRKHVSMELESQRLEEEIMKLKLRKSSRATSNFRPDEQMRAAEMDVDLRTINRLPIHNISGKKAPFIMALPSQEPRSPLLTEQLMSESEDLDPSPYDPKMGLVVFYDFLLGLCPSYRVCRLVVGMYSGDVCLGIPSILPPVYCEPVSYSQDNVEQKAIFATKQAVPEVQPASSISLVMQVQASGGYDIYGQEVMHLAPRGWMKLCIFDHHSRLISGRWKIPVRLLSAKPKMSTAGVNAVPQLENAELYLRIVNARDSEIQSSLPVSINNAGVYQYPPVQSPSHQLGTQESDEAIQFPDAPQIHTSVHRQRPVNTPS